MNINYYYNVWIILQVLLKQILWIEKKQILWIEKKQGNMIYHHVSRMCSNFGNWDTKTKTIYYSQEVNEIRI